MQYSREAHFSESLIRQIDSTMLAEVSAEAKTGTLYDIAAFRTCHRLVALTNEAHTLESVFVGPEV